MAETALYYRHSGRFSPLAFLSTLAAGMGAALLAGFVFGVLNNYLYFLILKLALAITLGICVGFMVKRTATRLHVRSTGAVALIGFLGGLAAIYAVFVGVLLPLAGWSTLIYEPVQVIESLDFVITALNAEKRNAGTHFIVHRLFEAGFIIALSTYSAFSDLSVRPYCESCGDWLGEMALVGPFEPIARPEEFRACLERGEFAVLEQLRPLADPDSGDFSQVELRDCETCDKTSVMTVRNIQIGVNRRGEPDSSSQTLVDRLLIDRVSSELIRQVMPGTDGAVTSSSTPEHEPDRT